MKYLKSASLAFAATALFATGVHAADDYPTKPIRLIVPYSAGGAVDIVGRVYAKKLGELLGQPVVVENKPGGGAMIGIRQVLAASADGYTLLMSTTTHTTNTIMYKAPGYSLDDFSMVSAIGVTPLALLQNANLPPKSYAQLIAYAKANPGKLNSGILGGGGITQLMTYRFKNAAGIETTDINFPGGGPAMVSLLAGNIDIFLDPMPTTAPQLPGGRIKALAVTSETRLSYLPDVPTFREVGLPSMIGGAWFAIFAPAKTTAAIQQKLRAASETATKTKEVQDRLAEVKIEPWTAGIEKFREFLVKDKELWEQDAKRGGIAGTL
ncbi:MULTISPECIES: Bug family tripartite tricarboxylate transporter substrate binding protein [Polaromonas]|uniref:Bug family tripartite tricarboxylate transporter substrate binding protein n=1 Tax=Polaromonas aquatica TaxID=332657 RepID=A0ABW1U5A9_9BURK